jgi:hypothetical protein
MVNFTTAVAKLTPIDRSNITFRNISLSYGLDFEDNFLDRILSFNNSCLLELNLKLGTIQKNLNRLKTG